MAYREWAVSRLLALDQRGSVESAVGPCALVVLAINFPIVCPLHSNWGHQIEVFYFVLFALGSFGSQLIRKCVFA